MTAGLCARTAWLSGRGVPSRRATSRYPRISGSAMDAWPTSGIRGMVPPPLPLSRECPLSGASPPAGRRGRSPAQSGGPRRAAPWRRATTASAGAPGRGRRAASDIARPPRGSAGRGSACTARPRRPGAPRGGATGPRCSRRRSCRHRTATGMRSAGGGAASAPRGSLWASPGRIRPAFASPWDPADARQDRSSPDEHRRKISPMSTRYAGARIPRNEDPALLRGQGLFVDDLQLPGMAHATVLRSPHANAHIERIDVRRARAAPGVLDVLTHADLGGLGAPLPKLIPHPSLTHHKTQQALASSAVRYVGEPVALVVAESRYAAEDAADLIEVVYTSRPAAVSLEAAAAPGAPRVHEDMTSNVCAHYTQRVGDVERAFAQAAHRFRERLVLDRGAAAPMETRGVVASWQPRTAHLEVWDSTQAPIPIRNGLAAMFHLPQGNVRVVAPDVGGGFGPKVMMFYPEEILVPLASH